MSRLKLPLCVIAGQLRENGNDDRWSQQITTIYYLARKVIGLDPAREEIKKLMQLFGEAPVNRAVLAAAVSSGFNDFVDAVVNESAICKEVQGIVTRDLDRFKKSKIQICSPEELFLMLESKSVSV